jgi:hypothetical protein
MKLIKKVLIPLSLSTSLLLASGTSSNIGYQGVAYKDGLAVTTPIAVRFTILKDDNSTVYQEVQSSITPSSKGFFSHSIGAGIKDSNSPQFSSINWKDNYKLKIEANFLNDTNSSKFTNLGIQEFNSVPYALKTAGVLGNNYTCYPSVEDEIKQEGYRSDKMVVIDGNVMTSRGPGTALCFGLEIVKRVMGEENYKAVKEGMLLEFCN